MRNALLILILMIFAFFIGYVTGSRENFPRDKFICYEGVR